MSHLHVTQKFCMDIIMPAFTKDEMLAELGAIFLFEADHIRIGAGEKAAEAFIGFPAGENEGWEYGSMEPAHVDLDRFAIAASFERGYEYAFRPSVLNTIGEHEVQDLSVFMLGTPRASGSGDTHRFMTPEGLCQIVADAVHARWKLEWDMPGHWFTTRELALLADMTEGAVRNALADKSEAGLRAIPGSKNPIKVNYDEALRWLKGRRGFIPTPEHPLDDRFLRERLREAETTKALGELVRRRTWDAFRTLDQAPAAFGWAPERLAEWIEGRQDFHEAEAALLAERLGFDGPSFVGKALEVIRRRDARQGGGA